MKNNALDIIICKSLANQITKDEKILLDKFLNESIKNKEYFNKFKHSWDNAEDLKEIINIDKDKAWKNIKNKIKPKIKILKPSILMKIAASITLIIIASTLTFNILNNDKTEYIYYSSKNSSKQIILKDNSKIILRKNTKIAYLKDLENSKYRKIKLIEGEAFFDIAENKKKQCIVYTDKTKTKVLGTEFTIKKNKKNITVALLSGKIKFCTDKKSIIINPNDKIVLDKNNYKIKLTKNSTNQFAWKTGVLIFENASINEIKTELENYFDEKIIIKNKTKQNIKFTATLKNKTKSQIIDIIEGTLGINIIIDE